MKEIYLDCILMDNSEIMFHGRSLGFLTEEEKKKYVIEKTKQIFKQINS